MSARQDTRLLQAAEQDARRRAWGTTTRLSPTFEVWTVRGLDLHDAIPMHRETFGTLPDAVFFGEQSTGHKGHFFVRQVDPVTGAATLHFYTVKQESERKWRKGANGVPVAYRKQYAEPLFQLAGEDRWPTPARADAEWKEL